MSETAKGMVLMGVPVEEAQVLRRLFREPSAVRVCRVKGTMAGRGSLTVFPQLLRVVVVVVVQVLSVLRRPTPILRFPATVGLVCLRP